MIGYKNQLEIQLKHKEQELKKLYKMRSETNLKENFWNLQSGINSLEVDVATIKSRIENLYKKDVVLPDHHNSQEINKYR